MDPGHLSDWTCLAGSPGGQEVVGGRGWGPPGQQAPRVHAEWPPGHPPRHGESPGERKACHSKAINHGLEKLDYVCFQLYLCVVKRLKNVVTRLCGGNSLAAEAVPHAGLWLVSQRLARLLIGHSVSPTVTSIPANQNLRYEDIKYYEAECKKAQLFLPQIEKGFFLGSLYFANIVFWKVFRLIDLRYWKQTQLVIVGRRSERDREQYTNSSRPGCFNMIMEHGKSKCHHIFDRDWLTLATFRGLVTRDVAFHWSMLTLM